MYDFYITPEEYELAKEKGILKTTLERRIRDRGWKKERALNEPPQKKEDHTKWYETAKSNGISIRTFLHRINYNKWTPEKAATYPVKYTRERNRKYSDEIYKNLEENNITRQQFYDRVRKGWSIERASTEKVWTDQERIKAMNEKSKQSNSGFKKLHEIDWAVRINGNRNKDRTTRKE